MRFNLAVIALFWGSVVAASASLGSMPRAGHYLPNGQRLHSLNGPAKERYRRSDAEAKPPRFLNSKTKRELNFTACSVYSI